MTSDSNKYDFLQLGEVVYPVSITIMLTVYKYGIAEIPSDMAVLRSLEQQKLLKVNFVRGHSTCMLTEKGADWVNQHLFQILVECPLILTYPVIVPGDEIQLLRDVDRSNFTGPLSADRGRYFLEQINKKRIVLLDDCDVPYQFSTTSSSNILQFRGDQLKSLDEELVKRFHPIRIKPLAKRLANVMNTLTLTEWVEELYNMSYTKWRIGESI